jgi:hypothetical protein
MGFLDFLKRKPMPRPREQDWQVSVGDLAIVVQDQNGDTQSVTKDRLSGVMIETNDSGPWGVDFWWILLDDKSELACAFPQGATGEKDAIKYLMQLEEFNLDALGNAMRSTNNQAFVVWTKPTPQ